MVQVWYIGADGLKAQISQRLRAVADPSTPIDVKQAQPRHPALAIDVETDPLRDTATVVAAVRAELLAPGTGVLEPDILGVGTPVFRAAIMRAVLAVAGTVSVRALTWNGSDFSALAANFGEGDSGADSAVGQADIAARDSFALGVRARRTKNLAT